MRGQVNIPLMRPGGGGVASGIAPGAGQVTLTRSTAAITALNTLSSVDQTLEGSTDPITIPQGVTKITKVIIALVCDYGAAVVSLATMSGVRLSGQGVGGGIQEFAGPGASVQGVTSGNAMQVFNNQYDTNIQVTPGSKPLLQAAVKGDTAPGGSYIMVTLQFA
jgi:hypothetical protein